MSREISVQDGKWDQPVGDRSAIDPKWGARYSLASSVLISLPEDHATKVFLDERITYGAAAELVIAAFSEDGVIGHVINCDGTHWTVVNEALPDKGFGISILTEAGKTIIAGLGEFKEGGTWSVNFSHLYPRIRNGRRVSVGAFGSGGTHQPTTLGGTITVNY